jgi:hypothetical protein
MYVCIVCAVLHENLCAALDEKLFRCANHVAAGPSRHCNKGLKSEGLKTKGLRQAA